MENMAKKVLLVDDEPDVQRMIARRLQTEGYEVVTASDGDEALKKALLEHPDVILMDVMLPKKSGNAVVAELYENKATAKIPVIFITCLVDTGEASLMNYTSGGNHIMGKPIDTNRLIQMIQEAVAA